ncbi:MAG: DUF5695 domain-containing protein [Verrucomicrobiota bacterium]
MFLLLVTLVSSRGAIISVNYDRTSSTPPLGAEASAGVVAATHWNNVTTNYSAPGVTFGDNTGAGLGSFNARLSDNSSANSWNTLGSADALLFGDWALTAGGTLSLTNVPYSGYNLYLYFAGWGGPNLVNYTIGGTTRTMTNTVGVQSTFVEGNNYVKFTGLTGSNLVVTVSKISGQNQGIAAFQIEQTGGNTAPAISAIPAQEIETNTSTSALAFTISDAETAAGSLSVSGSSGNAALVPNANIVFAGSGSNRSVTVTPALDQFGSTTITVTVSDGLLMASNSFLLTVGTGTHSNLTEHADAQTSYVSPWESLLAVKDGFDPADSYDHSHGAYGNWSATGTQWVEYDWPLAINTAKIDVYWWTDGGGIMPPSACRLKYWNGSSFVSVANVSGLGLALNQYNTTTFTPVTTTRLRLEFDSGAASTGILEWKVYDAGGSPTVWPGAPTNSQFIVRPSNGAFTGLKYRQDTISTEYLAGRLGDLVVNYRQGAGAWNAVKTSDLVSSGAGSCNWSPEGTHYLAFYSVTNGGVPKLSLKVDFDFSNDAAMGMNVSVTNLTAQSLEIGDLAVPLRMNDQFSGVDSCALKHSYIEGNGSFVFWMRPNSVGPCLLITPNDDTRLEYWDVLNGFEVYLHSKAAYAVATNFYAGTYADAIKGDRWRQPNTSLTLPGSGSKAYGFKFEWVDGGYDGVRQALVNNGKIDVHVVPGMTVPTDLFARIALNTTQAVASVVAEFPAQTTIQFLNATNLSGNTYQIYQVQFSRLGENKLTINYGSNQVTYLEFFVTEPVETLISKRSAFAVSKQVKNPAKWYDGMFCDWNMASQQMITPDNPDTMSKIQYAIASDDPANSRMSFLASKLAVAPVQSEVTALDYCISNFVWGGIQQTTNEPSPYGIYGTPDWNYWRSRNNYTAIGRGYDYPQFIVLYYEMYRVARQHPEIQTVLSANEYLHRAWGTARAMWQYGSYQQTGLMNEMIIPDLLDALDDEGMTNEAEQVRANWETKTAFFCSGQANLFGSEYSFDSTGFESTEAYAKYGIKHAGSSPAMGAGNLTAFNQSVQAFMTNQMAANMFVRGWLETAYYSYGSDFRQQMGNDSIVTYMTQMGGWGVLDYGLYYAANPADYLRLGYGSYLCGWSSINSGTPASNYGFFYPGAANDGASGSDFEPAAHHSTWYGGQPNYRGPWYYAGEMGLGYCAAIRMAATIVTDDPIFGRFSYGGIMQTTATNLQVLPKDGVRKRFHAMLDAGSLHLLIDSDRFAADQPITVKPDLSEVTFQLETGNTNAHTAKLRVSCSVPGNYSIVGRLGLVTNLVLQARQELACELPVPAGAGNSSFQIVNETVNTAPVFGTPNDWTINAGVRLLVTNTATDADMPAQTLTYGAVSLPVGATLNTTNGVFIWRPSIAQGDTTNVVVIKVTDSGMPNLQATNSFLVVVNPVAAPTISNTVVSLVNGQLAFTINGPTGPDYCIQTSTNLTNWRSLVTNDSPVMPFNWQDTNPSTNAALFYRVLIGP